MFFNVADSTHVAASTLKSGGATAPDRLVLANWVHLKDTSYDYVVDPSFDFTYSSVARPDSTYAVYWDPTSLSPGDSRTYVTLYGLSELDVDLQPPLALGVSGPATLAVDQNGYSPDPFDVVATVFNNGNAAATNVQLTLNLGSPRLAVGVPRCRNCAPGWNDAQSWRDSPLIKDGR